MTAYRHYNGDEQKYHDTVNECSVQFITHKTIPNAQKSVNISQSYSQAQPAASQTYLSTKIHSMRQNVMG